MTDFLLRGLLAALTALAGASSVESTTRLGVRIGGLWVVLHGPRVGLVRQQIARAYPEWSEREVRAQTRAVFEHFGESLAELVLLRTRHREELLARVDIEGLENLEAARRGSESGGVLVLSAHCGNWELAGIVLADQGIPMTAMYRDRGSPVLAAALEGARAGPGDNDSGYEFLKLGSAGLSFVRALAKGRAVLVLLDQNAKSAKDSEGVFVPFFGRLASVRPGPIRLAVRRGVPVVPIFTRRVERGGRHRVEIGEPLELDRSDPSPGSEAERRNVGLATATIEAAIRRAPSQWIWSHRRWRTQPESSPGQPAHM